MPTALRGRAGSHMKQLFLHIGSRKTGTSSIQRAFAAGRGLLARHGIHYLDTGAGANHSVFMRFAFDRQLPPRRQQPGVTDEMWKQARRDELRGFLAAAPSGAFVISGEGMEDFDPSSIARMLDFFAAEVDRITVIWFARPPRSHASSLVQQYVKLGSRAQDLRSIARVTTTREQLSSYQAHPAVAELLLPLYVGAELVDGCSVATMLRLIGAPPDLHGKLRIDPEANGGLTRGAVAFMLAVNEARAAAPRGSAAPGLRSRLMLLARAIPGERFRIPDDVLDHLLCTPGLLADLAWIEQAAGRSFAEFEPALPARPAPDARSPEAWTEAELSWLTAEEARALSDAMRLLAAEPARPSPALASVAESLDAHRRATPGAPLGGRALRKVADQVMQALRSG